MLRLRNTLLAGLMLCIALAGTDAFAQRRGGGRGNNDNGNRGGSSPRLQQPATDGQSVPRVQLPSVPNVRLPSASGNAGGNASGGVRVDGGGARIRTDGSAGGNIRVGEGGIRVRTDGSAGGNVRVGDGRVRGDGSLDGRIEGSVRRAGVNLPGDLNRTVDRAIYSNNINIGQRSLNIAPSNYTPSYQNHSWHRGYWNDSYGWNPQIGYGQGFGGYGNYGGYGIRLGNIVIGSGGGYGNYGGYGYGRYPIGWGYGGWGLGSSIYNSGYYPYANPYWGGGGNYVVYNYAQPIPVTTNASPSEIAMRDFASAREAFKAADYDTALALVNRAVKENPSDEVLHEFRALTQFATRDYNGAAATLNSVLAVGPGWDWATMASLYGDVGEYTTHLRALESYSKSRPDEAGAKFLLGYHYMTTGHPQAAAREFASVVKLEPRDRVAKDMLALVDKPTDGDREGVDAPPPVPAEETAQPEPRPREDVRPIAADAIAGQWKSTRDDGSKFDLDLKSDKTFTWKFNQGSRNEDFSGTYTTEGSLLVLQRKDGGAMVGHVAQDGDSRFTFKLLGGPADDAGLTFMR
ncbi:MAG: tetratricopeptide repeat protein [Pirellulaceae bacterium]